MMNPNSISPSCVVGGMNSQVAAKAPDTARVSRNPDTKMLCFILTSSLITLICGLEKLKWP